MPNLPFHVGIPARRGTYALVMTATSSESFPVGSIGEMTLTPGYYIYVGSALGPGGLRARLAHHGRPVDNPRWHIDYLRAHTELVEVWWLTDTKRHEEQWGTEVASMQGARIPKGKFGASDSPHGTHLLWFGCRPRARTFLRRLRQSDPLHPVVRITRVRS
jgi:Uri superfamily endonuclease